MPSVLPILRLMVLGSSSARIMLELLQPGVQSASEGQLTALAEEEEERRSAQMRARRQNRRNAGAAELKLGAGQTELGAARALAPEQVLELGSDLKRSGAQEEKTSQHQQPEHQQDQSDDLKLNKRQTSEHPDDLAQDQMQKDAGQLSDQQEMLKESGLHQHLDPVLEESCQHESQHRVQQECSQHQSQQQVRK